MTSRAALRLATRGFTGAVLVVSAAYLLVYLYRWEWNRAVISGVFFLGAELVAATTVLSSRLGSLERRIDDLAAAGTRPPAAGEIDVERESPFAWLDPAGGRLGVFVPFLMGAGVILSAVAFVVERLSGAVARTASVERPPALVGPPLPAGGLLAGPVPATARSGPGGSRPTTSPAVTALLVAISGLVSVGAIALLADATQARSDPDPDPTTLVVDVRVRDSAEDAGQEATALWVACQDRLKLGRVEVVDSGPGRTRLTITGVMGETARRRFTGCLEDATLERVRATVVSATTRSDAAPS